MHCRTVAAPEGIADAVLDDALRWRAHAPLDQFDIRGSRQFCLRPNILDKSKSYQAETTARVANDVCAREVSFGIEAFKIICFTGPHPPGPSPRSHLHLRSYSFGDAPLVQRQRDASSLGVASFATFLISAAIHVTRQHGVDLTVYAPR
jgi:hypothetical protein